jgi:hypothetical protein
VVALVGLGGACQIAGVRALAVSLAALALTIGVSIWALVRDIPGLRAHAWRIGFGLVVGLVAAAGWAEISPSAGILVPALAAASSPPAVHLAYDRVTRRRAERRAALELPPRRVLMDREMVDRRFAEIVRQLEESGETQDS